MNAESRGSSIDYRKYAYYSNMPKDEFKDYEPLKPSLGEILGIVIWSGFALLVIVIALINLI